MLAPLTRDQLEMLVVRMLMKHPEELAELQKKSEEEVKTDTLNALSKSLAAKTVMQAIMALELFLEQAYDYLNNCDFKNGYRMLNTFSVGFVECLLRADNVEWVAGRPQQDPDRQTLDSFVAQWESAWEKTVAGLKVAKKEDLEELFVLLADWRTQCSAHEVYGPLFSDPLRALKSRIKQGVLFTAESKDHSATSVVQQTAQPGDFVPMEDADRLLPSSSSSSSSSAASAQQQQNKKRKLR